MSKLGSKTPTEALIALISDRSEYHSIVQELKKPLFGHAIKAGHLSWLQNELKKPETASDWVSQSGPWGQALPLAMTLKTHQFDLAESIFKAGAKPDALVYHADLKEPIPLMAFFGMEGNDEAMRWLLEHDRASNHTATLNQSYALKHGFMKSFKPLAQAALKGKVNACELMIQMGVDPKVLSNRERDELIKTFPALATRLGSQSFMDSFTRQVKHLMDTLNPLKSAEAQAEASTELPHISSHSGSAAPMDPAFIPHHYFIQWPEIIQLRHQLNLQGDLGDLQQKTFAFAQQLSLTQGPQSIALLEEDQLQLKRLWEQSITTLMTHALSIPKEDRAVRFEQSESILDKLGHTFVSTLDTMTMMRQRAIIQAQRKMDVELAVVFDKNNQATQRFSDIVDHVESRAGDASVIDQPTRSSPVKPL